MSNRIKYVCDFCNFKFTRAGHVSFNNCPYCGKPNSWRIDEGDSASKLLAEVAELDI